MISKEHQLLFDLLKGIPPKNLDGVDADALYLLFQRHRLFPIASVIMGLLDEQGITKWKKAVHSKTMKSLHHTVILGQIMDAYQKVGIQVYPLKGPVLAQTIYKSIGERHFRDLDIMKRGGDIHQVIDIAGDLGYELKSPKMGLTQKQWRYYLKHKKHIELFKKDIGVLVEIHTSIENHGLLTAPDVDEFLRNPLIEKVGNASYPCLNRESTFLYLVIHGGLHQYRRLFWLRDVAEALKRWKLDHQRILTMAESIGIERLLGASLLLSQEYFDTDIPREYRKYLEENNNIINRLKRSSMYMIEGPEFPTFRGRLRLHFFTLRIKSGLYHKCKVIVETMHRVYIGKRYEMKSSITK